MRAILILSLLVGLSIGVVAESTPAPIRFDITDSGDAPFTHPVLRLVPLPEGADVSGVRIVAEATDATGPAGEAGTSGAAVEASGLKVRAMAPMVLRGLRVLPVVVSDSSSVAAKTGMPSSVEVEVLTGPQKSMSEPTRDSAPLRYGRSYFRAMAPFLPPEALQALPPQEDGRYLIITYPDFLPAAQTLAAWKTQKGLSVSVVTTTETGPSKEEIQAYISREYHNAAVPPEYVLLVGDVEQVPNFTIGGSATDQNYALTDGDDFLPDLFIGRLSVQDANAAEEAVTKIIHNERDPAAQGGRGWMGRGLVIATDSNAQTPRAVSRWCGQQMLASGWAEVDTAMAGETVYHTTGGTIPEPVNAGVSLVTYRGWAVSTDGWGFQPQFVRANVGALTNSWMLPVVFSFVCSNNKYDESECFGESWVRAGTAADPRGAVAFIGNSEHWSHTRFNDAMAIGAFAYIRDHGKNLSEILLSAKMHLLSEFPLEIPYGSDAKESVEFYFYIYNLLGDPEMDLWAGVPGAVSVRLPESIAPGANFMEVAVADSASGLPIEGVRIGLTQGNSLVGQGLTDADGIARVPITLQAGAGDVLATVTGRNVMPVQMTVALGSPFPYLSLAGFTLVDDGTGQSLGNGDGQPNPGETLEIRPRLQNTGASPAPTVEALLTSVSGGDILASHTTFGTIAAGAEAEAATPFTIRIDPAAEDGARASFILHAFAGADTSASELPLAVQAPALRYLSSSMDPAILRPGETVALTVRLTNEGTLTAADVNGVLRIRGSQWVAVEDSAASFGTVPPAGTGTSATAFMLRAAEDAPEGQAANLTLTLTSSSGAVQETSFSIPVGAGEISSPLGPDGFGHWFYDSADTDYPDTAPVYDWIECSPVYGGAGTRLDLRDNQTKVIALPFAFRFYGVLEDSLQVSDNGWVSFDTSQDLYDFYNWTLPCPYGPGARVAPFWDNLDPKKHVPGQPTNFYGDGIYYYEDNTNHRFIVEWSRLGNTDIIDEETFTDLQTFEVILYDPDYISAPDGEGVLQFQYKQILNIDPARMYSTVGIENMAKSDGIEYTYSSLYPAAAAPLSAGLAIRITTQKPRYSPFQLAAFGAQPSGGGVALSWEPIDSRPRGGTRIYRAGSSGRFVCIMPALSGDARSFVDAGADPDSTYEYKVGSLDPSGRETLLGPYRYEGGSAVRAIPFSLQSKTANPFRGSCEISWSVPRRSEALLRVYNVAGRAVRTLVETTAAPGIYTAQWDGRDEAGHPVPAGLYFARLSAGGERRDLKLITIR